MINKKENEERAINNTLKKRGRSGIIIFIVYVLTISFLMIYKVDHVGKLEYALLESIITSFSICLVIYVLLSILFEAIVGLYRIKEKTSHKLLGIIKILFAILSILILELTPIGSNYLKIDDKIENSAFKQINYIVKDCIQKNTETIILDSDSIDASIISKRRVQKGGGTSISYIGMIKFVVTKKDNKTYAYQREEKTTLVHIIKDLKNVEDKIKIEYYTNSGIIKSIDDIEKTDYTKLQERVDKLKKDAEIQEFMDMVDGKTDKKLMELYGTNEFVHELIESLHADKSEQRTSSDSSLEKTNNITSTTDTKTLESEIKILSSITGKNIQDAKQILNENNIEGYNFQNVSSKMAEVNTVVYVSYKYKTLYVVKDDSKEDLVKFPKLEKGMKKDEFISILKENQIKYEFTSAGKTNDLDKVGTLVDIPESYGQLYPKELTIILGIYTYSN